MDRAIGHVSEWATDDDQQLARIDRLAEELESLRERAGPDGMLLTRTHPWDAIVRELEKDGSLEASELINSLLIELYPELVDDLEATTGSAEREAVDPLMSLAALRASDRTALWLGALHRLWAGGGTAFLLVPLSGKG